MDSPDHLKSWLKWRSLYLTMAFLCIRKRFMLRFILDMTSKIVSLMLTVSHSMRANGVAIPTASTITGDRWCHPCRGSITSHPQLLEMIHLRRETEQVLSHRIWLKAHEVIEIATILRDEYAENRIQSPELQYYLDDNTTLPGFPDHRTLNIRTAFVDRVHEDYRRAAVMAVFIQQMKSDEEQSSFSPSLNQHFRHLESELYPFLCFLKMTHETRFSVPVPYVSRDVMTRSLRNVNTTADRHMRDYRILRDLVSLFYSIQRDYDTSFIRDQSESVYSSHER